MGVFLLATELPEMCRVVVRCQVSSFEEKPSILNLVILRSEATKDLKMRRCEINHLRILRSFASQG